MRGLWATSRNAFAEVAAKPRALAVQMLIMAINDFVWVIFWVLFFDRVGTLGGWDRDSIILLQAVLTTAGGLSLGLFANARSIGTMAVGGDLVLPAPVRLAATGRPPPSRLPPGPDCGPASSSVSLAATSTSRRGPSASNAP